MFISCVCQIVQVFIATMDVSENDFKISNKATKFCTKVMSYNPLSIDFNALYALISL